MFIPVCISRTRDTALKNINIHILANENRWFEKLLKKVICFKLEQPSLDRGSDLWPHLSPTYNISPSIQFNTCSYFDTCDPNNTHNGPMGQWSTCDLNNSQGVHDTTEVKYTGLPTTQSELKQGFRWEVKCVQECQASKIWFNVLIC